MRIPITLQNTLYSLLQSTFLLYIFDIYISAKEHLQDFSLQEPEFPTCADLSYAISIERIQE